MIQVTTAPINGGNQYQINDQSIGYGSANGWTKVVSIQVNSSLGSTVLFAQASLPGDPSVITVDVDKQWHDAGGDIRILLIVSYDKGDGLNYAGFSSYYMLPTTLNIPSPV